MGDHGGEPHGGECQPTGEREDRSAGHAGADGTAAGEHAAEAHERGTDHIASHAGAVVKALQRPVAGEQRGNERADEHAGDETDIEAQRQHRRIDQAHQRVSRGADEADALDRDRRKRLLRERIGEQPAGADHQPDADRGGADADAQLRAPRQTERHREPHRAEQHAERRAAMEQRQQVARGAAVDGPEIGENFTRRREDAAERSLRHDGEDQSGDQRAQIAGGGEDEEPRRAAARQDHTGAKHQAADDAAREAAAHRKLPRFRNVEQTDADRNLRAQDRSREGEQPDGGLGAEHAARDFNDG